MWAAMRGLILSISIWMNPWKTKFAKPFTNPRAYFFLIRQIREIQSGSDVN